MPLTDAEATAEVARMKARQARRAYGRPQIDRYRDDLLKLRQRGADFRSLSDWLGNRRIPVAVSPLGVGRWFDREYPDLGRPKTIRKRKEKEAKNAGVQPKEADDPLDDNGANAPPPPLAAGQVGKSEPSLPPVTNHV